MHAHCHQGQAKDKVFRS